MIKYPNVLEDISNRRKWMAEKRNMTLYLMDVSPFQYLPFASFQKPEDLLSSFEKTGVVERKGTWDIYFRKNFTLERFLEENVESTDYCTVYRREKFWTIVSGTDERIYEAVDSTTKNVLEQGRFSWPPRWLSTHNFGNIGCFPAPHGGGLSCGGALLLSYGIASVTVGAVRHIPLHSIVGGIILAPFVIVPALKYGGKVSDNIRNRRLNSDFLYGGEAILKLLAEKKEADLVEGYGKLEGAGIDLTKPDFLEVYSVFNRYKGCNPDFERDLLAVSLEELPLERKLTLEEAEAVIGILDQ